MRAAGGQAVSAAPGPGHHEAGGHHDQGDEESRSRQGREHGADMGARRLVCRGTVEGGTGMRFRMDGRVVGDRRRRGRSPADRWSAKRRRRLAPRRGGGGRRRDRGATGDGAVAASAASRSHGHGDGHDQHRGCYSERGVDPGSHRPGHRLQSGARTVVPPGTDLRAQGGGAAGGLGPMAAVDHLLRHGDGGRRASSAARPAGAAGRPPRRRGRGDQGSPGSGETRRLVSTTCHQ